MNVAIIDADLIEKRKHRFPNLACMKISGYQKEQGNKVILKLDYDNLTDYDQVFISKVFTDTPIDSQILQLNNVVYGGTGFYYDKADPLSYEVEHHMPDYHLYDEWIDEQLKNGGKRNDYKYYLDYSIGYTTRGCFRHSSRYDGDYIFAFDNIADYDLIERKLKLIREYTDAIPKFYVFCGFDRDDKWDYEFWTQDIFDMMKRIRLLQQYHCLPYIMRFNRYIESPYQGVYKVVAAWCNQPSFFKKKSLLEFASLGKTESVSRLRHINKFLQDQPAFEEYINMKWS